MPETSHTKVPETSHTEVPETTPKELSEHTYKSEMPETSYTEVPETTPKELSEHTYIFNVGMSCSGCSGAVERVLGKLAGVKSYDINLDIEEEQGITLVTAETSLDYDTVYEKINKTGKTVYWGEADGVRTVYKERTPKPAAAKTESEKEPEIIAAA